MEIVPLWMCRFTDGHVVVYCCELSLLQVIDGWLELRFPGNLQGINTDRYAEHMAQREEECQA